jgi:entericidin B
VVRVGLSHAKKDSTMNPIFLSRVVCAKPSATNRFFILGFAFLATAAFALSTTSCATTKGFGRDVEKVGDKIERAADRTGGAN